MRRSAMALLVCGVLVAGCGEQSTPVAPAPEARVTTADGDCISPDSVRALIRAVFPAGQDRSSALSRFNQIVKLMDPTPPGPNEPQAQLHAINLVEFVLAKYYEDRLIGGRSLATRELAAEMLNGILCTANLPAGFTAEALGDDGAAAVIQPNTDATIVTGNQFAGIDVDAGTVNSPVIITITRLPDSPGPLLTALDQYPLFYEYTVTPETAFNVDVLIGTCLAGGVTPPDPSRLRLAHNVPPFTFGSIEILPIAPVDFLDCTDADIGLAPAGSRWMQLARGGFARLGQALAVLAPRPAYAATRFAGTGLGGTVRTFSPFGAVDTLVTMTGESAPQLHAPFGTALPNPPSVVITTPTGAPVPGVSVAFAVTAGGGSVAPATAVTDGAGRATVGSWTLGLVSANGLTVSATPPHARSGVGGSPVVFTATGF